MQRAAPAVSEAGFSMQVSAIMLMREEADSTLI